MTPSLAYCLYACSARHTGTDWSRNYVSYPHGRVRRLLPIECERLQGFPEGWTIPEKLDINDPDTVNTLRYHALGNAVTVPVAAWLAGRIRAYLTTADKAAKAAPAGQRNGHAATEYELVAALAK